MQFGKCRLHLENAKLQESHILPNWAYRRAIKAGGLASAGGSGGNVLLKIGRGEISSDPKQLKEHLLCVSCEKVIKKSEDYVSEITWQLGGNFPALEKVTALPDIFGKTPGFKVADGRALKSEEIAKFAVSVLWRASVSSLPELSDCKLRKYEEDFRSYLRDEATFPSCARIIVQIFHRDDGLPLEQTIFGPAGWRVDGHHHVYQFMTLGMCFMLAVGGEVPRTIDEFCFVRTRQVLVGTGDAVVGALARQMGASQRKGKIARGLPMP